MDYQVPDEVIPYLDFIAPTKRFPSHMQINETNINLEPDASSAVTPEFLRELYSIGDTVGSASDNIQGVASFLGEC